LDRVVSSKPAESRNKAVVSLLACSGPEGKADDETDDQSEFETHLRIVTHLTGISEPG
jgi:hypothetical protein